MRVYENFDLTQYNSYKLKATCAKAFFIDTEEDAIAFFKENKQYILLGSGHNIILSKEHYEPPVLIFNGNYDTIAVNDRIIEAEAGAMMWDVSKVALEHSLSGLEIFYDIPSSLGGAIVMNAGASGEEIKDFLVKVRYLDLQDLTIKEILKEDMTFEYRNSFFQKNSDKIILKAWLQLHVKNKGEIQEKMERIKKQRWAKQPKEFPNAGSVFKRPKGFYVGAMIEELGLKGFSVGGAKISEKHGGFIVNYNNATGQDILTIIAEVKSRVKTKFFVDLEVEQRII